MRNLLYKELRLAAHPNLYVFACLGALVLVPAYPYGAVFMFGCLGPYISVSYARENHDVFYTALLPVPKRDAVKAKLLMFAAAQITQLVFSVPFAFLRTLYLPQGNPAGIEANAAYYGFGLLIFAVFDFIFFSEFYKTAYKAGRAFLLGFIPAMLLIAAMEAAAHVPALAWIDSTAPACQLLQLPVLAAGALIYPAALFTAYRVASKEFEKVDL
ncbi:MAG: hypothetical protein DBY17_04860 [Oscillospiraceae bacterium]|jgi:hypothetical protein|nr:MAG: hypothetical protein DBY17_04860 [Oscillospiraceae bacterium]